MTRTATVVLSLAMGLVLTSCASGGGGGVRRDANEITMAELADPSVNGVTAFEAIQRLRPNWLRSRGTSSISAAGDRFPALMLNDVVQPLDVLQSLRAADLTELRFITGPDATTLYGTGYVNGMIRVSTGAR